MQIKPTFLITILTIFSVTSTSAHNSTDGFLPSFWAKMKSKSSEKIENMYVYGESLIYNATECSGADASKSCKLIQLQSTPFTPHEGKLNAHADYVVHSNKTNISCSASFDNIPYTVTYKSVETHRTVYKAKWVANKGTDQSACPTSIVWLNVSPDYDHDRHFFEVEMGQ